MTITKRAKHKGPKACGKLFANGNWIGMIARKLGTNEAMVDVALMRRIRQLERQVRNLGGRP